MTTSSLLTRARSAAGGALAGVRGSVGTVMGRPPGRWTAADVPDQSGRTVLVTGANAGLGLQTALSVARAGARVLMTSRDPDRGELARARVAATATGPAPELVLLDLTDLASVRAAAHDVAGRTDHLDVLVANAGVMMTPLTRTVDGFELQLGTNHLGHFALTGLLLPLLLATSPAGTTGPEVGEPDVVAASGEPDVVAASGEPDPGLAPTPVGSVTPTGAHPRVVVVSSLAHASGRVVLSDLQFDRRPYSPFAAYAQSKLANLLFVRELQHRADEAGRRLLVAAAHPGLSATGLYASSVLGRNARVGAAVTGLMGAIGQDDVEGALPQLYAATMGAVRPGEYFGPSGIRELRGSPTQVPASPGATDDATAAALWLASEDLTGVVVHWG